LAVWEETGLFQQPQAITHFEELAGGSLSVMAIYRQLELECVSALAKTAVVVETTE
jgi:hypothetical protein